MHPPQEIGKAKVSAHYVLLDCAPYLSLLHALSICKHKKHNKKGGGKKVVTKGQVVTSGAKRKNKSWLVYKRTMCIKNYKDSVSLSVSVARVNKSLLLIIIFQLSEMT